MDWEVGAYKRMGVAWQWVGMCTVVVVGEGLMVVEGERRIWRTQQREEGEHLIWLDLEELEVFDDCVLELLLLFGGVSVIKPALRCHSQQVGWKRGGSREENGNAGLRERKEAAARRNEKTEAMKAGVDVMRGREGEGGLEEGREEVGEGQMGGEVD